MGATYLFEVLQQLSVDEAARALMQRAVDGDDVTLGNHLFEIRNPAGIDSLGGIYVELSKLLDERTRSHVPAGRSA